MKGGDRLPYKKFPLSQKQKDFIQTVHVGAEFLEGT